jgi:hypothetical protein
MSSTTNRPEAPAAAGTWSVALRLTLWYVASSFAILLVATISLYLILVGNLRGEEDAFLVDKIETRQARFNYCLMLPAVGSRLPVWMRRWVAPILISGVFESCRDLFNLWNLERCFPPPR